eukprot:7157980-Alexandrium_andersonii.AAC.1
MACTTAPSSWALASDVLFAMVAVWPVGVPSYVRHGHEHFLQLLASRAPVPCRDPCSYHTSVSAERGDGDKDDGDEGEITILLENVVMMMMMMVMVR